MKEKTKQILGAVLVVALVAAGVGLKKYNEWRHTPQERYTVGFTDENTGESFIAIMNLLDEFKEEKQRVMTFNYDLSPADYKVFAMDFPIQGYKCGLFTYELSMQGKTMIINGEQDKKCDKEQLYYVTTLLQNNQDFDAIEVRINVPGKDPVVHTLTVPERVLAE